MTNITISRSNGEYPLDLIADQFVRHGIFVLKDFLAANSSSTLRSALELTLEHARSRDAALRLAAYPKAEFLLGDILSIRALKDVDYIFFRTELLRVIRSVLKSDEILYFGDSSIQFGEGARGFHKDNVERHDASHSDWQGDYGLIRCGFYFQDHDYHSGGLKVRLGSHNIADHRKGRIWDVPSTYGDLVVWNMRLTHSGNTRRLRGFGKLPLHPRVESLMPSWSTMPEEQKRISAFCAFARPGTHTDHYIQRMITREADYAPYLRRARRPSETEALLKQYHVSFIRPNENYGELDLDEH